MSSGLVRLSAAIEKDVGLQKEIDIKLEPHGSRVTLIHRIQNVGKQPTELAPWALSVMAAGGPRSFRYRPSDHILRTPRVRP